MVDKNVTARQTNVKLEQHWFTYKRTTWIVLVCAVAVGVGVYVNNVNKTSELRKTPTFPIDVFQTIGLEPVKLFMKFDANWDDVISLYEFRDFYRYVTQNGTKKLKPKDGKQPTFRDDDEIVTVQARFKPLDIRTLRQRDHISVDYSIMGGIDTYGGLKQWQYPNKRRMNLAVRQFNVFLPSITSKVLGDVYEIVELTKAKEDVNNAALSNHRYKPPNIKKKYLTIHKLLTMFHERPFIFTRFIPRGALGIVRARNEKYNEIVFRIHAEFQLNEPPAGPFWFTPAQFTGSLIISQDFKHIHDFHMYVPADKRMNVDLEWLEGPGMMVDIGYMREMSLHLTAPSVPLAQFNQQEQHTTGSPRVVENITWVEEIPLEKALRLLDEEMYPFKKVEPNTFKTLSYGHTRWGLCMMGWITNLEYTDKICLASGPIPQSLRSYETS